jgi:hypothetical protein
LRDARSDLLQRRGAEVVVADIFDPGQLMDAMRDVQRAYYCPPYHPFVIQSASAFAAAARETGLEQIVGLSQWLAGPNHPALMSRQLWLIDRVRSPDLRQGSRAARAADAVPRARRRRLDGEPPRRGLSGGQYAEESNRMTDAQLIASLTAMVAILFALVDQCRLQLNRRLKRF